MSLLSLAMRLDQERVAEILDGRGWISFVSRNRERNAGKVLENVREPASALAR